MPEDDVGVWSESRPLPPTNKHGRCADSLRPAPTSFVRRRRASGTDEKSLSSTDASSSGSHSSGSPVATLRGTEAASGFTYASDTKFMWKLSPTTWQGRGRHGERPRTVHRNTATLGAGGTYNMHVVLGVAVHKVLRAPLDEVAVAGGQARRHTGVGLVEHGGGREHRACEQLLDVAQRRHQLRREAARAGRRLAGAAVERLPVQALVDERHHDVLRCDWVGVRQRHVEQRASLGADRLVQPPRVPQVREGAVVSSELAGELLWVAIRHSSRQAGERRPTWRVAYDAQMCTWLPPGVANIGMPPTRRSPLPSS